MKEEEEARETSEESRARERRRYDIARCKLQFCCEIIIKYIMPSRLLPHNPPPLVLPSRRARRRRSRAEPR